MNFIEISQRVKGKTFASNTQKSFTKFLLILGLCMSGWLNSHAQIIIEIEDIIAANGLSNSLLFASIDADFEAVMLAYDSQQAKTFTHETPSIIPFRQSTSLSVKRKLFPNPATTDVAIGIFSPDILLSVDIEDQNGNNVFSESNPGSYSAPAITAGTYTVYFHTNQGTFTDQLTVQ